MSAISGAGRSSKQPKISKYVLGAGSIGLGASILAFLPNRDDFPVGTIRYYLSCRDNPLLSF
jgi:hypothetical protein